MKTSKKLLYRIDYENGKDIDDDVRMKYKVRVYPIIGIVDMLYRGNHIKVGEVYGFACKQSTIENSYIGSGTILIESHIKDSVVTNNSKIFESDVNLSDIKNSVIQYSNIECTQIYKSKILQTLLKHSKVDGCDMKYSEAIWCKLNQSGFTYTKINHASVYDSVLWTTSILQTSKNNDSGSNIRHSFIDYCDANVLDVCDANISGMRDVFVFRNVGPFDRSLYIYRGKKKFNGDFVVTTGEFHGSLYDFERRVYVRHGGGRNKHQYKKYMAAINLVKELSPFVAFNNFSFWQKIKYKHFTVGSGVSNENVDAFLKYKGW